MATNKPETPLGEWASDIQLAHRFSVSRATIWRWTTEGFLPQPSRFGHRTTRWRVADADAAIAGDKPKKKARTRRA